MDSYFRNCFIFNNNAVLLTKMGNKFSLCFSTSIPVYDNILSEGF